MVDGIDLFAVARRIVEGSAKSIANERLEAAARMAIVNLRRVVGGGPGSNEIRIVAERNDRRAIRERSAREVQARPGLKSTARKSVD